MKIFTLYKNNEIAGQYELTEPQIIKAFQEYKEEAQATRPNWLQFMIETQPANLVTYFTIEDTNVKGLRSSCDKEVMKAIVQTLSKHI